jgi:Ca2+-binding RTX toxin-like protein
MAASKKAVITGSTGADSLVGDQFGFTDDIIFGLGSNDTIEGLSGDDVLFGGFGDDVVNGSFGEDYIEGGDGADTLDGGSDTDVLSYAVSDDAVTVDLLAGTAAGGHADGDVISGFEDLVGSQFDDTLSGDGGKNVITGGVGDDLIRGKGGKDTLIGGAGEDTLRGDGGRDVFVFVAETDSTVGNPDEILDFVKGDDLIDLSAIDADVTTVGDQAFSLLLGGGAFTGAAGELRDTGLTLVGDTDGDGVADFAIEVMSAGGGVVLTAADIVL